MITRFIFYGMIGWNMEILWTGIGSALRGNPNLMGHTSLWMFLIYGSAAFAFEPVHELITEYNFFVRGCIWTVLIFAMETAAGAFLRLFGIEAWHYTAPMSVYGLIRLDYFPAWFVVGMLFERLHDVLIRYNIGVG